MAPRIATVRLSPLPAKPRKSKINGAWRYLEGAYTSVAGLFDGLNVLRQHEWESQDRDARGRLNRDQTNLLRAALVFTSSGLDACCKRLLRGTLPTLVLANSDAERKFKQYVGGQLDGKVSVSVRAAILDASPRDALVNLYVEALAAGSLQGTDDLKKVRDALGISVRRLPDSRIDELSDFFMARNAIVHDLDYRNPTGKGRARNPRSLIEVGQQCDEVLHVIADIIVKTAANLPSIRRRQPP